jgi:arylsulfatase A-like enzyme
VIDSVAQHIDLVPTILSAVGAAVPTDVEGESLLPLLKGSISTAPDRMVLSLLEVDKFKISSVIHRQRHLLRWNDGNPVKRTEFFDVRTDPRELHDLHYDEKLWNGYLLGLLEEARERSGHLGNAPQVHVSGETEKRLRALGYIH